MPDINHIHFFYKANIPEYKEKDIHRLNKFFLEAAGFPSKKSLKKFLLYFNDMKEFICYEWFGLEEIEEIIEKKIVKEEGPNDYTIMKYGKHAGEKLGEIPVDYLVWCFKNHRCSPEVKEYIIKNKIVEKFAK